MYRTRSLNKLDQDQELLLKLIKCIGASNQKLLFPRSAPFITKKFIAKEVEILAHILQDSIIVNLTGRIQKLTSTRTEEEHLHQKSDRMPRNEITRSN